MLASALDQQELDDHRDYCLAGGDPKKFKWSSPDKAGTKPKQEFDIAKLEKQISGDEASVAKALGRELIYRIRDRNILVDTEGAVVDADSDRAKRAFIATINETVNG